MTRFIHLFNAGAWLVNTVLWATYAGSWLMALASMGAVVLSFQMAKAEKEREQWR